LGISCNTCDIKRAGSDLAFIGTVEDREPRRRFSIGRRVFVPRVAEPNNGGESFELAPPFTVIGPPLPTTMARMLPKPVNGSSIASTKPFIRWMSVKCFPEVV
jgi:hypothetical protein